MPDINEAVEYVTISKQEYDELRADQNLLSALGAAGVDNWDGYDVALEISGGNE